MPLPTTIAGSLPKPAWLAEPEKLRAEWRLSGDALHEEEQAGIDDVARGRLQALRAGAVSMRDELGG